MVSFNIILSHLSGHLRKTKNDVWLNSSGLNAFRIQYDKTNRYLKNIIMKFIPDLNSLHPEHKLRNHNQKRFRVRAFEIEYGLGELGLEISEMNSHTEITIYLASG